MTYTFRLLRLYLLILGVADASLVLAQQVDSLNTVDRLLSEVSIVGARSRYRYQNNTLIYSAQDDEGAKFATSTADVLRRVPLVTIGTNDTPMIQGSANVKVLINGEEIFGISPSQVLSLVPPTSIRRIEVSTLPGAKYAADGAKGVINIITSRQFLSTLSGTGNMGLGSKGSHLSMTLLSPLGNKKRWSIQANLYALVGYSGITSHRRWVQTEQSQEPWLMESSGNSLAQLYNGGVNLSYNKGTSKLNMGMYTFVQHALSKENYSQVQTKHSNGNQVYSFLGSYERKFQRGINLKVYSSMLYTPISNSLMVRSDIYQTKRYVTLWLNDFTLGVPIGDQWQFVAGGRWAQSQTFDEKALQENQSILATYLEGTYNWTPRFSSTMGVRYERWKRRDLASSTNTFLSMSLSYQLDARTQLSAGLQQRISRPTLADQITTRRYLSEVLYQTGNPFLESSKPVKYELGLSRFQGANFLKLTLHYENAQGLSSYYVREHDGLLEISPVNTSQYHSWGVGLWNNLSLLRGNFTLSLGINIQHLSIEYRDLSRQGWQWDLNGNMRYRIGKNYAVNFWGSLQSQRIHIQGYSVPYTYSNLSLERSWGKGAYALAVSLDNPFSHSIKEQRVYEFSGNKYEEQVLHHNRGLRIIFRYSFGKKNIDNKNDLPNNILNSSL